MMTEESGWYGSCAGSVEIWRWAQTALLSAQNMDIAGITKVTFASEDHVHDVIIHNFDADRFEFLYSGYRGRVSAEIHPPAAPGDQEHRQVRVG
jgi:hypothetical protein